VTDTHRPTILVALRPSGELPPGLIEKAGDLADFVTVREADEIGRRAGEITSAFVWNFRSTVIPDAVEQLTRLRWVHVAASGVDASLSDPIRRRAITFTNSRGVTAEAMAEYALALLLGLAKDLPRTLDDQLHRRWAPRLSTMLAGRTMVTLGVGAVNRALASRAAALGVRVIGVARRAHPPYPGFERIDAVSDLRPALAEADLLVIATPLTPQTARLIGAEEFAALRPGATVVNIGRGAVIDEAALLAALRSGHLAGAALDVLWREPLEPEHELWSMPNVIISPHMSSDFVGWEEAMVDLYVANLRRYLSGQDLLNVVDLDLGYVSEPDPVGAP
jgi:phosphoglycerate dehydrogenase-like enzyme